MFFRKKQLFYTQEKKPRRFLKFLSRLTIMLLVLVISTGVYLRFFIESAGASWFDDNWLYRQSTTVTNGGSTVTDYQIAIPLDTAALISAGKMQSTCNDIRITDVNGKTLPIWIETGAKACNTASTAIWTKAASLPAGTSTFYIYYGNTSAPNIQSGDKIFEFFDDFSGNTLNPGKWTTGTVAATAGTDFTVGSGVLSGGNNNRYVQSAQPFTGNYIAETRENTATQNANGFSTIGFWATSSNNFGILDHNSSSYYRNDAVWVNYAYNGTGQWNRDKVKVVGTSAVYYRTGETSGSSTNTATNSGISGEYLRIGARYDGGTYNQNFVATWDFIIVRKAVATEPTIGTPASEEKAPTPVAYWKFDGNLFDQTSNKNHAVAGMSSVLTPNYVDGISGSAIDFTTSDWSTNLSYVSSTVVQDSTKSWTTNQWAGYTLVSNYEAVGGYCRQLIVSNTATNLTLNGTCNSWSGTKTYRIKKVMWVQDTVNYGTTNVSVEAWYRRTASKADTNNTLVRFSGSDVGIEVYDTYITGYVDGYTNGFNCTVTGTDQKWHHISITYDGATVKLYYDGKQCNTRSQVSTLSNNETVMIGTRNDGYSAFFEGYIDDFKIYPYTRSVAEVKTDFNSRGSAGAGSTVLGTSSNNNIAALSQGLVGNWQMNEATWSGTLNEVLDSSGNGNNGQAQGASNAKAYPGAGKYGNGGVFDGVDDYVGLGNITSYKIDTKTISFWANPSVSPSQTTPVFSNGGANYYVGFSSSGRMMTSHSTTAGAQQTSFSANSIVVANEWHLYSYIFTISGSDVRVSFYKDGTFLETDSYASGYNASYGSSFIIGAFNSSSFFYNGKIDDVRIYSRALSPTDVANLYNFAPGPVGYWNLDEKSGTTASDTSGNGNNGTWSGTGNHFVSGKVGGAGKFDGSSDSIAIPDTSALNPSAISVSTWFKPTSTLSGLDVGLVSKWNAGVNDGWFIELGFSGANARVYTLGLSTVDWQPTLPVFNPGTWYHFEFTYDGTTKNVYINGVLTASQASTGSLDVSDKTVKIGYSGGSGGGNHYFPGAIDETKFYNYARTAKQITEDMQGSRPAVNGRGAGTVGYWKFDEGTGTSAKDYSGNGNVGTLTNMATAPSTSTSGWSNGGRFGKALSFDGSNDYVTSSNINGIPQGQTARTISVWVKPTNTNPGGAVVSLNNASGASQSYSIELASVAGTTYLFTDGKNSPNNITITGSQIPQNGVWSQITFTFDGSSAWTYYLNGVQKKSGTFSVAINTVLNNIEIGRRGDGVNTGAYFPGSIDEVKIYSYALTADDVKKDYSRGSMQVLGSVGTDASGNPSNSTDRSYCPPGDTTATCGPVGEWNFEEAQGTSVNDTSGNGNTGTLGGTGSSRWVAGKVGKAGGFNGTDDYVSAGSNPITGTAAFTMSAWLKADTHSNYGLAYYIGAASVGQSAFLGWVTTAQSGTNNSIGAGLYGTNYGSGITDNNWHYVTLTFAGGASGAVKLYVDGVVKVSTTATPSLSSSSVMFGKANSGTQYWYHGNVDQARLYNYALSQAQISWEYNRGAPMAWYKMDECQGTSVRDMTGNGNDGTLTVGASGTQTSVGTCQTSSTAWGNGATGKVNYSLNFDGTDDYVQASKSNTPTISGSFSTWLYPDSTMTSPSGYPTLVRYGSDPGMYIQQTTGKPYIQVGTSGGSKACVSSKALTASTWQHIVGTYETSGADILLKVYLNGQLVCTNTQTSVTLTQTANSFAVGSALYKGQLDDVRIYNYSLTASQIKDAHNGGAVRY